MGHFKVNFERIKEDATRGVKLWKPKPGENRIRILPPWSAEGRFYRQIFVHFRVGSDNRMVVCPRKTPPRSGVCAVCEYIDHKLRTGTASEQEEARQMFAKQQYLYNIVDLKEPEKGVQVYASGVKVWNRLIDFLNYEEFGDFTDPQMGRSVIITRTGEGRQVEYGVALSPRQTPLDDMSWLDQLYDLDTFLRPATYEETKEALHGALVPEGEEEVDSDEEDPSLSFGPPFEEAVPKVPSCLGNFRGGPECMEKCHFVSQCVEEVKVKAKTRSLV